MKLTNVILLMLLLVSSCKESKPIKDEKYRSLLSPSNEILDRYQAAEIPETFSGYSVDFEQLIKVNNRLALTGFITIDDIIKIDETYKIRASSTDLRNANCYFIELDADETMINKIRVYNLKYRFSTEMTLIFDVESFSKPHLKLKDEEENDNDLIQIFSNNSFIIKGKAIDYVPNK